MVHPLLRGVAPAGMALDAPSGRAADVALRRDDRKQTTDEHRWGVPSDNTDYRK
jgi:hypothetical protein